jgi:hypothetical protein
MAETRGRMNSRFKIVARTFLVGTPSLEPRTHGLRSGQAPGIRPTRRAFRAPLVLSALLQSLPSPCGRSRTMARSSRSVSGGSARDTCDRLSLQCAVGLYRIGQSETVLISDRPRQCRRGGKVAADDRTVDTGGESLASLK